MHFRFVQKFTVGSNGVVGVGNLPGSLRGCSPIQVLQRPSAALLDPLDRGQRAAAQRRKGAPRNGQGGPRCPRYAVYGDFGSGNFVVRSRSVPSSSCCYDLTQGGASESVGGNFNSFKYHKSPAGRAQASGQYNRDARGAAAKTPHGSSVLIGEYLQARKRAACLQKRDYSTFIERIKKFFNFGATLAPEPKAEEAPKEEAGQEDIVTKEEPSDPPETTKSLERIDFEEAMEKSRPKTCEDPPDDSTFSMPSGHDLEAEGKESPPFKAKDGFFSEERVCDDVPDMRIAKLQRDYDLRQAELAEKERREEQALEREEIRKRFHLISPKDVKEEEDEEEDKARGKEEEEKGIDNEAAGNPDLSQECPPKDQFSALENRLEETSDILLLSEKQKRLIDCQYPSDIMEVADDVKTVTVNTGRLEKDPRRSGRQKRRKKSTWSGNQASDGDRRKKELEETIANIRKVSKIRIFVSEKLNPVVAEMKPRVEEEKAPKENVPIVKIPETPQKDYDTVESVDLLYEKLPDYEHGNPIKLKGLSFLPRIEGSFESQISKTLHSNYLWANFQRTNATECQKILIGNNDHMNANSNNHNKKGNKEKVDENRENKSAKSDFTLPGKYNFKLEELQKIEEAVRDLETHVAEIPKIVEQIKLRPIQRLHQQVVRSNGQKIDLLAKKVDLLTKKVVLLDEKVPFGPEKNPPVTEKVPLVPAKVPLVPAKVPLVPAKVPLVPEKPPLVAEKLPLRTEKLPLKTEKLPPKAEKLPLVAEKLPVGLVKLPFVPKKITFKTVDKTPKINLVKLKRIETERKVTPIKFFEERKVKPIKLQEVVEDQSRKVKPITVDSVFAFAKVAPEVPKVAEIPPEPIGEIKEKNEAKQQIEEVKVEEEMEEEEETQEEERPFEMKDYKYKETEALPIKEYRSKRFMVDDEVKLEEDREAIEPVRVEDQLDVVIKEYGKEAAGADRPEDKIGDVVVEGCGLEKKEEPEEAETFNVFRFDNPEKGQSRLDLKFFGPTAAAEPQEAPPAPKPARAPARKESPSSPRRKFAGPEAVAYQVGGGQSLLCQIKNMQDAKMRNTMRDSMRFMEQVREQLRWDFGDSYTKEVVHVNPDLRTSTTRILPHDPTTPYSQIYIKLNDFKIMSIQADVRKKDSQTVRGLLKDQGKRLLCPFRNVCDVQKRDHNTGGFQVPCCSRLMTSDGAKASGPLQDVDVIDYCASKDMEKDMPFIRIYDTFDTIRMGTKLAFWGRKKKKPTEKKTTKVDVKVAAGPPPGGDKNGKGKKKGFGSLFSSFFGKKKKKKAPAKAPRKEVKKPKEPLVPKPIEIKKHQEPKLTSAKPKKEEKPVEKVSTAERLAKLCPKEEIVCPKREPDVVCAPRPESGAKKRRDFNDPSCKKPEHIKEMALQKKKLEDKLLETFEKKQVTPPPSLPTQEGKVHIKFKSRAKAKPPSKCDLPSPETETCNADQRAKVAKIAALKEKQEEDKIREKQQAALPKEIPCKPYFIDTAYLMSPFSMKFDAATPRHEEDEEDAEKKCRAVTNFERGLRKERQFFEEMRRGKPAGDEEAARPPCCRNKGPPEPERKTECTKTCPANCPELAQCSICRKFDIIESPPIPRPKKPTCKQTKCGKAPKICPVPKTDEENVCGPTKKIKRKDFCAKCPKPDFPVACKEPKIRRPCATYKKTSPCFKFKPKAAAKKRLDATLKKATPQKKAASPKKPPEAAPATPKKVAGPRCPRKDAIKDRLLPLPPAKKTSAKVRVAVIIDDAFRKQKMKKCHPKKKTKSDRKTEKAIKVLTTCEKKVLDAKKTADKLRLQREQEAKARAYKKLKHTVWKPANVRLDDHFCSKKSTTPCDLRDREPPGLHRGDHVIKPDLEEKYQSPRYGKPCAPNADRPKPNCPQRKTVVSRRSDAEKTEKMSRCITCPHFPMSKNPPQAPKEEKKKKAN